MNSSNPMVSFMLRTQIYFTYLHHYYLSLFLYRFWIFSFFLFHIKFNIWIHFKYSIYYKIKGTSLLTLTKHDISEIISIFHFIQYTLRSIIINSAFTVFFEISRKIELLLSISRRCKNYRLVFVDIILSKESLSRERQYESTTQITSAPRGFFS